ncbi:F-box/LRR-repeat protein 18-like isoform X2 [Piliocolobus tephrosceles]|uniref:F-box/LRR-repeat protein 18-like isoform X2 n=1 Tax=Piliocolobus tephrosceles TaxID=591936 RepID=UPI000E6AF9CA|nr:F-box/LRR-repeat protein 18-like isoform X2 [Piliocolobus tephrosceles]
MAAAVGRGDLWAHVTSARLEQPYFSANAQFFQALSQCPSLQRLCLVSRSGTLQPDAVLAFMARCLHVVMCHLFTGESLATCKSLQQSLLSRHKLSLALSSQVAPEGAGYTQVPGRALDHLCLLRGV